MATAAAASMISGAGGGGQHRLMMEFSHTHTVLHSEVCLRSRESGRDAAASVGVSAVQEATIAAAGWRRR